ncbi:hypothetical protein [Aquimarina algiphila]|uniref:hypothetical protein n=1 Tax=Aquimarina algiphila TaxID=2047982 RepID=UPI002492C5A7|nr:hypothetical protein [Aquimarina algiphila]
MKTYLLNKNVLSLLGIYLLVSIVPLFLSHSFALSYSFYNYATIQILIFGILFCLKEEKRNIFLLSPSFIAVSYINLNFLFGSIVFKQGLVFDYVLIPYQSWENYGLVIGYFNLINFAIIASFFLSRQIKFFSRFKLICDFKKYSNGVLILIGLTIVLAFSYFDLSLDFLGGDGDFSIIPKTLGILIIIVCFSRFPSLTKRLIGYLIIIAFFSAISWENKRNSIFLLLPILLLESRNFKVKLNLKKVALLSFSILLLLQLILAMSIFRGYGGYKPKSFLEANGYVFDYIQSKEFIPAFMNNLEISYTYFHSNNAIQTILKDPEKITYGETLIKPFFIFIPRRMVSFKPRSIIHHYTITVSSNYRSKGGSWPISFQSEMFWNFHFFGIFVGFLFFIILNSVYLNIRSLIVDGDIINFIPLLYFYQTTLVLFRGSGLDMFTVFIILATVFSVFIKLTTKILLNKG